MYGAAVRRSFVSIVIVAAAACDGGTPGSSDVDAALPVDGAIVVDGGDAAAATCAGREAQPLFQTQTVSPRHAFRFQAWQWSPQCLRAYGHHLHAEHPERLAQLLTSSHR